MMHLSIYKLLENEQRRTTDIKKKTDKNKYIDQKHSGVLTSVKDLC